MRVPLHVRLIAAFAAAALLSTSLALAILERSLAGDLRRAANARLGSAARGAGQLLTLHLAGERRRYESLAVEPRFRAALEARDGPTLSFFAGELLGEVGAAHLRFLDAKGRVVASAGPAWPELQEPAPPLLRQGDRLHFPIDVRLASEGAALGRLQVFEPVRPETLRRWSELCGAQVTLAGESPPGAELRAPVPGAAALEVHLSLAAERQALVRARRHLLLGGGIALGAAALLALVLSRGMAAAVGRIRQVAERIGKGDLSARIGSGRRDELGDVARGVDEMAGRLEAWRARLVELDFVQGLMDGLPDAVLLLDRDGRICRRNRRAESLAGAGAASWTDVLDEASRARVPAVLSEAAARSGAAAVLESELAASAGTWYQWDVVGLSDGSLLSSGRDVTHRKWAEKKLAEQARELARSNQDLHQFAYVASHDLKEPLGMISTYLKLLVKRTGGSLDPEAEKFIQCGIESAERTRRMIDDLLRYAGVDSRFKPQPSVDSGEALGFALENLGPRIEAAGAVVTRDPLPRLPGDGLQLTQLFQNLVGNAVKYRRKDEPPRIHVEARRDAGLWVFSVGDNGTGIDPRHFQRIFEIFQRAEAAADSEGTGIGLALCKKIVERHGGKIWVESRPGEGSMFRFALPAGTEGEAALERETVGGAGERSRP